MKSRKDEQFFPKHSFRRTSVYDECFRKKCSRKSYYILLMFFIAYAFKGHVHVFAGWVKVVSHSSCRTSAIFKYFCPLLTLCPLVLSADKLRKQFRPRPDPTKCWAWSGFKLFDILTVFLKEFFEKVDLKKSAGAKMHAKVPRGQRVNVGCSAVPFYIPTKLLIWWM